MTTTTKPLPPHGSLSRHKYHGCKCSPCRSNYRDYQNRRYRQKAYGTWQPYVDAEPIRRHLLMLRDHGISFTRVAEIAGLYPATVGGFLYRNGRNHPPKKRATRETADKILAVTPDSATPGIVDATGTHRRLQALAAVGWPMSALAPHTGLAPATVSRLLRQPRLYAATGDAVSRAYNRLWDQRPEDHGVTKAAAVRTRRWAHGHGWAPPAAWDDDRIDDPGAVPDIGDRATRSDALAEDALWLIRTQGYTRASAAERLGTTRGNVDAAINRWSRRALAQHDTEKAA